MAAQDLSVTGKVKSEQGEPLPGVAVMVKGTSKGVATDRDGRYQLAGVPEGSTLVFKCEGFADAERPAALTS